MSDMFRVGERVSWWEDFPVSKRPPCTLTGIVTETWAMNAIWWAEIECDSVGFAPTRWVRSFDQLTLIGTPKMDAHDAAAAARSETTSVFAGICEDYEETMRWAGDVGAIEL